MRKIRGIEKLVEYLDSIDCPISRATMYRLMKTNSIPVIRPAPRVIIFDLDEIDKWLSGEKIITLTIMWVFFSVNIKLNLPPTTYKWHLIWHLVNQRLL